MPRLTKIEEVLFPVKAHPLFASLSKGSKGPWLRVSDKRAIVNTKTKRVLGVVGKGYQLVTNREALKWAIRCCRIAFPETRLVEWQVHATDAPSTGGHCYIDLVHNSAALDFAFVRAQDKPDAFGPFIRVTNSYNGLRALSFAIGFFRKVCWNGLILPESIIRFKFTHSQSEIGAEIDFEVARERFTKLRATFGEYLGALRDCRVGSADFGPLFRGVLRIREPKNLKKDDRIQRDWHTLSAHIEELCARYRDDLGENAYAVFNAVTEFASHPPENRCVHRERHGFQLLAGEWVSKFSQECRLPEFALSDYLTRLAASNGESGPRTTEGAGVRRQTEALPLR